MATEAEKLSFDKAKSNAVKTWGNYLGRIKVQSPDQQSMTKFYTGLYHALLGRGLASDVNGAYPKNDGGIGQIQLDANHKPLHNHYNTDAIWGGFWNLTQLWAIAYPNITLTGSRANCLFTKIRDGWQMGSPIADMFRA
jgi:putative alpha-1,2-mannosidase